MSKKHKKPEKVQVREPRPLACPSEAVGASQQNARTIVLIEIDGAT